MKSQDRQDLALSLTAFLLALCLCGYPTISSAQDITLLGGDLTSHFTDRNAIQLPAPNIVDSEHRNTQLNGFGVFHGPVTKKEGLGPRFNHDSCGSCHVNNGTGKVKLPTLGTGSTMVVKVSLPGLQENGAPIDVPKVGEQLLDHNLKGQRLFDISLSWKYIKGKYPDGSKYQIRKPKLHFVVPHHRQRKLAFSLRMTPIVIGPGLIEAISEEDILALSDPEDTDGDGISGRPQYVPNVRTGGFSLGRFGFRASHPTLEQQSAAAAYHDIGRQNSLFLDEGKSLELSDLDLRELSVYLQLAGVPTAQNQSDPEVIAGKGLFSDIGCNKCHVMTFITGTHEFPELENQTIHPFTDLLLHDMGSGLADKRKEFSASGSEWRTSALWGLGYSTHISKVKRRFLHDGRARSIEEAILWHSGESESIKQNFMNLSKSDRQALLAFLESL